MKLHVERLNEEDYLPAHLPEPLRETGSPGGYRLRWSAGDGEAALRHGLLSICAGTAKQLSAPP